MGPYLGFAGSRHCCNDFKVPELFNCEISVTPPTYQIKCKTIQETNKNEEVNAVSVLDEAITPVLVANL